jgi:predicted nucleic acid-binding protein
MTRILLDTSAYSALLRGSVEAKEALQGVEEIIVTPIVIGELLAGFSGGRFGERNRLFLREFLDTPRVRVINIDPETSERYAAVWSHLRSQGTPIPTNDLWIAASAMQHGLVVLTTDQHFLSVPQVLTVLIENSLKS